MSTKTSAKPAAAAPTTHYATRDFKDAGTTRFFSRGDALTDVSDGELGNYRAAGLASTEKPKSPAEAEKAALDAALG
ncbi:hypothetical protein [uncultured Sphingomonas sp.]|uniref:hypothetical protein n=1 Tax=uncultured Sphingomonas sp. TaxID=158754 RepID=UPI0025915AC5|nr:hypothetical protein [uncultured Sphingomonas sp.]